MRSSHEEETTCERDTGGAGKGRRGRGGGGSREAGVGGIRQGGIGRGEEMGLGPWVRPPSNFLKPGPVYGPKGRARLGPKA